MKLALLRRICTRPVSTADSKSAKDGRGRARHLWIVLLSCSTRSTWTPAIYMHMLSRVSALFLSVVLPLNSSRCHRFPASHEISRLTAVLLSLLSYCSSSQLKLTMNRGYLGLQ